MIPTQYTVLLSCRECGGPLTPRTTGRPIDEGIEIRAIADCPTCRLEHLISVRCDTRSTRPAKARRSASHLVGAA
jgi:hypothetical protein